MPEFLGEVGRFQEALLAIPPAEVRTLEQSLDRMVFTMRPQLEANLRAAQEGAKLPPHRFGLLDHLFQRWTSHGPAIKLALLAQLGRISALPDEIDTLISPYPELAPLIDAGADSQRV